MKCYYIARFNLRREDTRSHPHKITWLVLLFLAFVNTVYILGHKSGLCQLCQVLDLWILYWVRLVPRSHYYWICWEHPNWTDFTVQVHSLYLRVHSLLLKVHMWSCSASSVLNIHAGHIPQCVTLQRLCDPIWFSLGYQFIAHATHSSTNQRSSDAHWLCVPTYLVSVQND